MGIVHDLRQPARRRMGPSPWARIRTLLLGDDGRGVAGGLADQPGVVGAYPGQRQPLLALARQEPVYEELRRG